MLENLAKHNISLPAIIPTKTLFKPATKSGNLIYVSGQLPVGFGDIDSHIGQLGKNISIEKGQEIASYCMLNAIAQASLVANGASITKCVKITVFVNSVDTFTQQHLVANGASEILLKAFGDGSEHSRSAIGVAQLPLGVAVEVEAIFEIN